jgi:hypothetical protein
MHVREMDNGLSIGLGREPGTCCNKLVTQFAEVLDNPIMDDCYRPRAMGMRIFYARRTVCCPTRVADTPSPWVCRNSCCRFMTSQWCIIP